ncbi:ester cyclase [Fulvivirga sedimenti]|uniref:Ester cyclase n=1 Tax=Fulvivirga sedimenti TaxID=2879465 RepID=A0A9X1HSB8_9BACT|nr:nuclear transport factor 2 family protein [Fulvivirga sedimenti]MCA6075123.1 ester cyclase [Fulvivirga sedimenti]MCA6076300.1 ester cyclase [Fulvivirga sedimenti]MCA6077428.1 ester cyclase [Fulvivirga sedimenti]
MKQILICILLLTCSSLAHAQTNEIEESNKALARGFYDDLWFSNNTDNYVKYMADTYVAHDIGDRKGVVEPAVEQKNIADFFWENGEWHSRYDYQIAEGDLVATRWIARYEPKTLFGKVVLGEHEIPIINVFRFKDGKIVELWNHRHDIDGPMTRRYTLQGFAIGLLIALIPTILAFRYRRKLKRLTA